MCVDAPASMTASGMIAITATLCTHIIATTMTTIVTLAGKTILSTDEEWMVGMEIQPGMDIELGAGTVIWRIHTRLISRMTWRLYNVVDKFLADNMSFVGKIECIESCFAKSSFFYHLCSSLFSSLASGVNSFSTV